MKFKLIKFFVGVAKLSIKKNSENKKKKLQAFFLCIIGIF